MEKKKVYIAPVVEQMECKVEKGFAGSGMNNPAPNNVQAENIAHEDAMFF